MLGIQPQGEAFDPLRLSFEFYTALRSLGLDVDILPPNADLEGYSLVVAPSLPVLQEQWVERLQASSGHILFGPRSGSKTREFQIPAELPPGPLQPVLPLRVSAVESLRPGHTELGSSTWRQASSRGSRRSRERAYGSSRVVSIISQAGPTRH
jgi:beta-galactosidase